MLRRRRSSQRASPRLAHASPTPHRVHPAGQCVCCDPLQTPHHATGCNAPAFLLTPCLPSHVPLPHPRPDLRRLVHRAFDRCSPFCALWPVERLRDAASDRPPAADRRAWPPLWTPSSSKPWRERRLAVTTSGTCPRPQPWSRLPPDTTSRGGEEALSPLPDESSSRPTHAAARSRERGNLPRGSSRRWWTTTA